MDKKIMFFDIDGTLLSETTHTIPSSATKALKLAQQQGHLIFINTGRPISLIDDCIKELNPDGYICGCGTYIEYHGEVLFSKTLSQKCCFQIRDLIRETNVEGVLEGKTTVYFDQAYRHQAILDIQKRYIETPTFTLSTFDDPDLSFDKFCIWFDEQSDIQRFRAAIKDDFEYIIRADDFGEIIPADCSKATGIQFLADYFNLNLDDTYVFGDSFNDETMLKYVKHAIVMGNGEPALFKDAFYVTKDIEDDGIYHALKHLELI